MVTQEMAAPRSVIAWPKEISPCAYSADTEPQPTIRPKLFGWKEALVALAAMITLVIGSVILILLSVPGRRYQNYGPPFKNDDGPFTAYTLVLPGQFPGTPPLLPQAFPGMTRIPGQLLRNPETGATMPGTPDELGLADMATPIIPLDKMWSVNKEKLKGVTSIIIRDFHGSDRSFSVMRADIEKGKVILMLQDGYRLIADPEKALLQHRHMDHHSGPYRTEKVITFNDRTRDNMAGTSVPTVGVDLPTGAPARRLSQLPEIEDASEIMGLEGSLRRLGKNEGKGARGLGRLGKKAREVETPPPEIIRTPEAGGPPSSFMDAYCRYGCGGMAVTFPYYYRPFFGYGYPLVGTQQSFPGGYGGYAAAPLLAAQAGATTMGGVQGVPVTAGGFPVTNASTAAYPQAAPMGANPYQQAPVFTGPGVNAPYGP